jgi:hypothetical protein
MLRKLSEYNGNGTIQGRDLSDGDINRSCLINEEAYKQYGLGKLEGKRYNNCQMGGFEIVGKL